MVEVRVAEGGDVGAWAELSAGLRERLATWGSPWWRKAGGADDVHPLWLGHLVAAEGPVARVAVDGDGAVVGAAVAMPQPGQWHVDDLVVADGRWDDAGAALVAAVVERPALTCVATADDDRRAALGAAGLRAVARYWIGPPGPSDPRADDDLAPPAPGTPVAPGPPHTFGGSLDPHAAGAVALTDRVGGLVVASPPLPAPPVYDPGGPVGIVDRLTGDRARLLDAARAALAHRGDALLAVVADPGDEALAALLADRGLSPLVEVLAWPLPT